MGLLYGQRQAYPDYQDLLIQRDLSDRELLLLASHIPLNDQVPIARHDPTELLSFRALMISAQYRYPSSSMTYGSEYYLSLGITGQQLRGFGLLFAQRRTRGQRQTWSRQLITADAPHLESLLHQANHQLKLWQTPPKKRYNPGYEQTTNGAIVLDRASVSQAVRSQVLAAQCARNQDTAGASSSAVKVRKSSTTA